MNKMLIHHNPELNCQAQRKLDVIFECINRFCCHSCQAPETKVLPYCREKSANLHIFGLVVDKRNLATLFDAFR